MIGLRNAIIRKEVPGNENPGKIFDIVGKSLDFNKQQESKEIKVLTPKKWFKYLQ